jgi:hypothetical protein
VLCRALAGHRAELHRVQGEVGQTASRERVLGEDIARLKADADTRIAAVERRAADVQVSQSGRRRFGGEGVARGREKFCQCAANEDALGRRGWRKNLSVYVKMRICRLPLAYVWCLE